ncbi:MAG: hypothetical protein OEM52_10600 [bacterium]|nr:hypothetical protein [bacterium]
MMNRLYTTSFYLLLFSTSAFTQIVTWQQTGSSGCSNISLRSNGELVAAGSLVGTGANGVYLSTDNGLSWTQTGTVPTAQTTMTMASNGSILVGTMWGGGVFLSSNNGSSWISTTLTTPHILSFSLGTPSVVYSGSYGGVYKSVDNGSNWSQVLQSTWVHGIASNVNGTVFAGKKLNNNPETGDGLWRSVNAGGNWTRVLYPTSTSVFQNIFVTSSGVVLAVMSSGTPMYRSLDNGNTWVTTTPGFIVNADPGNTPFTISSDGTIYIGTSNGVYSSVDNGLNWSLAGLSGIVIRSLLYVESNILFATTAGILYRGVISNFNVVSPNGGNSFQAGTQDTIRWASIGITGNVNIELNRNYPSGNWEMLFANTPNDGEELWTVSPPATTTARIRITSVANPAIGDTSDANFTIWLNPNLYLSSGQLNFPNTNVHSTDSALVKIANPNHVPFQYLSITPPASNAFSLRIDNTDSTIAVNDTLRIWVRFAPDSTLSYNNQFILTYEQPYNQHTILLSGTGNGTYAYPISTTLTFPTTEPTLFDSTLARIRIAGNRAFTGFTPIDAPPFYWGEFSANSVAPGDTLRAWLYFAPEAQGTFSGELQLISNAINEDTLRFHVSGISSYVPAAPGNLAIVRTGNDINLQWDRVDTSLGGVPLTVTYYLVFFKNLYTDSYAFLGLTSGANATTYTHLYAAQFSSSMYYQVRAWIGDGDAIDRVVRELPVGTSEEDVLHRLGGQVSQPVMKKVE